MTEEASTYNGLKIVYSIINDVGKIEWIHAKKNETGSPSYTTYENTFKIDQRLKW